MIIDTSCYPTQVVDLAWRHDGEPFTGERLLKMMDGPYTVCGKPRRIDKAFIQPPQGNTIYTDGVADLTGRDAIRALWEKGTKAYEGRRVSLPETTAYPRERTARGLSDSSRPIVWSRPDRAGSASSSSTWPVVSPQR